MAQTQSYDIPLHDIKPIVEIEEYSFYYFLGLSAVVVILLLGALYLIYRFLKSKNRFNKRKEHFQLFNGLNLDDTKESAYLITFYGATFKDDSPRHKEMYENLTNRLQLYKYKKSVNAFDKEVIGYIELYKEMIDV